MRYDHNSSPPPSDFPGHQSGCSKKRSCHTIRTDFGLLACSALLAFVYVRYCMAESSVFICNVHTFISFVVREHRARLSIIPATKEEASARRCHSLRWMLTSTCGNISVSCEEHTHTRVWARFYTGMYIYMCNNIVVPL